MPRGSAWYVVHTLPRQEARAVANLRVQGFDVWLPSLRRTRRHARRIDAIEAPMFPGYLFVRLDPDRDAWSPINGTAGVRRLISRRERPVPLPAFFVDSLRAALAEGGPAAVPQALRPGERIRLIGGPFVDVVGTLLHHAAGDRVALLLNVLGQDVLTLVSRRMVTLAA